MSGAIKVLNINSKSVYANRYNKIFLPVTDKQGILFIGRQNMKFFSLEDLHFERFGFVSCMLEADFVLALGKEMFHSSLKPHLKKQMKRSGSFL